jgi:hypothetical protein
MKYTVVWRPRAEARLAELWLAATDRAQVAHAADEIERLLRTDPETRTTVHVSNKYFLVVRTLGVAYLIREQDRVVEVTWAWRYHPQVSETDLPPS